MSIYHLSSLVRQNRKSIVYGALCLLVVDVLLFAFPFLVKLSIDHLKGEALPAWLPEAVKNLSAPAFLILMGGIYAILAGIVAYGRFWWRVFFIWSSFPLLHQYRMNFFRHLHSMSLEYFKKEKVGDLLSALTTDSENLRMALAIGGFMVVDTIIYFILYPIVLWTIHPGLTLAVIPVLALSSFLALLWSDRLSGAYENVQHVTGRLSARAYEIFSGVRVIKSFRGEQAVHSDFLAESRVLRDESIKVLKFQSYFVPGLNLILGSAIVVVLIWGGLDVIAGTLALSSLVAYQLYLSQLEWPMLAMGWFIQLYRSAKASEQRVLAHAHQAPGITKSNSPQVNWQSGECVLEVRELRYRPQDEDKDLLVVPSLKLKRGERVGITGPVGAGKTLLLELLSRQRDPSNGDILHDGTNLKAIAPEEVASRVLYVPQETFLFSKSLRNNLCLGLKRQPSDSELLGILKDLCFDLSLIESRGGLDVVLGERGLNFSGGQKQRLSIARALLREADVYLFDDLFSHVDQQTESLLLKALKQRLPSASLVLLVSQRLDTLASCDRLLVIESGKIGFDGSLAQGIQNNSFLMRLQSLQGSRAA
jgi:ATP-binding cassette subfamily B protein